MMRTRRGVVVALTVLALSIGVIVPSGASRAAGNDALDLSIGVPDTVVAGDPIVVTVRTKAEAIVRLTVFGAFGNFTRSTKTIGGIATVTLDTQVTRAAGALDLIAAVGSVRRTAEVEILPASVGPSIDAAVGARAIVADGSDVSMVVTTPTDIWGNAVADGTEVVVSHQAPSGAVIRSQVHTAGLIAWDELGSGIRAGGGWVWVAALGRASERVSLAEVAGPPVNWSWTRSDLGGLVADGSTLVHLQTTMLRDAFGNVEPDGTVVTAVWRSRGMAYQAASVSVGGVATLAIQSPVQATSVAVSGAARGLAASSTLALDFSSALTGFPVTATRHADEVDIEIGPVLLASGGLAPDGAAIAVTVSDGHLTQVARGFLLHGKCFLVVAPVASDHKLDVRAEVLGATESRSIP